MATSAPDAPPPAPLRRAAASASSLAGAGVAPPQHPLPDSSASPSPPSTSPDPEDSPKAGRWAGGGLLKGEGGGKCAHPKESAPFLPVSAGRHKNAARTRPGHHAAASPTARRIVATFASALCAAVVATLIIARPWLAAGWALREGGPVLRAGRDWQSAPPPGGGAAVAVPPPLAAAPPAPPPPAPSRIPRIVHQTWRGPASSLPPAWAAARARCAALHPGWTFKLWSDGDGRALVARAAPGLLATYDAYPDAIQRADVMRYVALWSEGGVYLDLDVECARPMDGLLTPPAVLESTRRGGTAGGRAAALAAAGPAAAPPSAILPITWPVSLSNDVMAAEPGSPLMAALIAAAPGAARVTRHWPRYARVMFSTGPMLVTAVATGRGGPAAAGVLSRRTPSSPGPLFGVLPAALYGKYGAHGRAPTAVRLGEGEAGGGGSGGGGASSSPSPPSPLFIHLHGSSWHGSDAAAAIWAAHHGWALGGWGAALGVAVLSGGALVYVRVARAARARADAPAAPAPRRHHRRPSSANLYSVGAVPGGERSAAGAVPPPHSALDAAAKMC